MQQAELSIVLPTYNEALIIEDTLEELARYLKKSGIKAEVIVADTSDDDTRSLALKKKELFYRFIFIDAGTRQGKGYNVGRGVSESTGKYVVFMDADLSTPLSNLSEALDLLRKGDDVVVGTRQFDSFLPAWEAKLAKVGTAIMRKTILPSDIADTQCGFKGFSSRAATELFYEQTVLDWGFDIELLYLANRHGYRIKPMPVRGYSITRVRSKGGDLGLKVDLELARTYIKMLRKHWQAKSRAAFQKV